MITSSAKAPLGLMRSGCRPRGPSCQSILKPFLFDPLSRGKKYQRRCEELNTAQKVR